MSSTTIPPNALDLLNQPEQLIQRCIDGDRQSQNKLYTHFSSKMFGVCLRYSKNREEAEEILQEGFVQVFKSLQNFKQEGSFEGWIRKIIVHTAISYFRAKPKMYAVVNVDDVWDEQGCNAEVFSRLHKKDLLRLVQQLPPACRLVFNLYVFEGLKHREIAAALKISEGTSKSNLHDAKMRLQKAVEQSFKIAKNY